MLGTLQVAALKNLGLNIKRANLAQTGTTGKHKFYVTDAGGCA
jgi:hypothetical protein